MQQDRKWRGVCSQDDNLTDTSVQRLGRLVGAFLKLSVVRGLLDEVENFLRQGLVGDRPGCGFVGHFRKGCDGRWPTWKGKLIRLWRLKGSPGVEGFTALS